jgi:Flp pilus assembly pilin Flp
MSVASARRRASATMTSEVTVVIIAAVQLVGTNLTGTFGTVASAVQAP